MADNRRVLVFTGNGKGKTTAALGMTFRAAGHGMRGLIYQFIKGDYSTGEIESIERIGEMTIMQTGLGFVPPKSSPNFPDYQKNVRTALDQITKLLREEKYDIVVLDEICTAVTLGLIEDTEVVDFVKTAPEEIHLVLTGRGATDAILELADTATEMRPIKHAFDSGIRARKGIEF